MKMKVINMVRRIKRKKKDPTKILITERDLIDQMASRTAEEVNEIFGQDVIRLQTTADLDIMPRTTRHPIAIQQNAIDDDNEETSTTRYGNDLKNISTRVRL